MVALRLDRLGLSVRQKKEKEEAIMIALETNLKAIFLISQRIHIKRVLSKWFAKEFEKLVSTNTLMINILLQYNIILI